MHITEFLNCKIEVCEPDHLVMRTPVTKDMTQPHGILHGGISAFLAEEAGSTMVTRNTDINQIHALGLDMTTTHLLPVQVGDTIRTEVTPVRNGGKVRVMKIEQFRESDGELFNVSQLTLYMRKPR